MAMRAGDQQTFGFVDTRNHGLRRGVYLLPSAFTAASLFCGFYAVLATLKGSIADFDHAAWAIGLAIVFDNFDGFLARVTQTNSDFGKQFDSLADMVSFGIAPAILAFSWGVRNLLLSDSPEARQVVQLSWLVSFTFVMCCAWRLARFNVHGMLPDGGLRYFVGLPTPAAAAMIAAVVHARQRPLEDWRWSIGWLLLVLVTAALMVSTIRYPSFKGLPLMKRQHSMWIVVVGLVVWSIVVYSEAVLLLIASGYLVTGLTMRVIHSVRRLLGRPTGRMRQLGGV
jgi:CDP-diacylglycerol---serine O-phosphatidyltransferase